MKLTYDQKPETLFFGGWGEGAMGQTQGGEKEGEGLCMGYGVGLLVLPAGTSVEVVTIVFPEWGLLVSSLEE